MTHRDGVVCRDDVDCDGDGEEDVACFGDLPFTEYLYVLNSGDYCEDKGEGHVGACPPLYNWFGISGAYNAEREKCARTKIDFTLPGDLDQNGEQLCTSKGLHC